MTEAEYRAAIALERKRGRVAISSMMADFALSYGWEFYSRWYVDYKSRRWWQHHRGLAYLSTIPVIDPSTASKITSIA